MNYQKLDKKAVLSWRIDRCIGFLILCIVLITARIIIKENHMPIPYLHYCILGAALLIIYKLIGIIIYPVYEYRQWRYIITEDKIEFCHGIFFLSTTVIPIVRVQHITISRGPIYRKLGLSKVKIFLASGSFEIEGLNASTAEKISDYLKSKVIERLNREN